MSAVVGTILMVAVTVMVAAALYTIVDGFGSSSVGESPNAVFKAQTIDATGNGYTDSIRLSYVSGPTLENVTRVSAVYTDGTVLTANGSPVVWPTKWVPGDSYIYDGLPKPLAVTVTVSGVTVTDQIVTVQE